MSRKVRTLRIRQERTKDVTTTETLHDAITRVLAGLNEAEQRKHDANGYTFKRDEWHAKGRDKFIALDCGGSGAFLIEKRTGELYNIQGYGRPDRNKKKKADIGNIFTVDPAWLWTKRYNYLR